MDIDRILVFASRAGKLMLQSGGEIYRVEETVCRICKSFGVDDVDAVASPTSVVLSIVIDGKVHSICKRIRSRKVNLNIVHNINALSRIISNENLPIEECEKRLYDLCKDDSYSNFTLIFYSAIATSTFSILFGGNINTFLCAFIIGALTKIISIILSKSYLNDFFINGICGAFISICSILCLNLGFINELDKLIAGCIMLLVPGLSLTNSIRDILQGELVSGLTRVAEATFIGISIAVGTGGVLHLCLKAGGL